MRTRDIIKTGIDRNFLRQCIDKKIITPRKDDNQWINQNYIRHDFSQEDLEKVWNAYMCRQMGLSYENIISLQQGNNISLRSSLNELIQKYQNKIAELQTLIQFMKYIKGIGFIPSLPEISLGSESFTQYLKDFMTYLDEDETIIKMLDIIEPLSNIKKLNNLNDEYIDEFETKMSELNLPVSQTEQEEVGKLYLSLRELVGGDPAGDETQNIIYKIYCYEKKLNTNQQLTIWDFVKRYIFYLSFDSDISAIYKTILGEEGLDYYHTALIHFLIFQDPQKAKEFTDRKKEESDNDTNCN